MRYFVTGATGWIGSAVTAELLAAGHQVVGLARSDASAAKLTALGAEALPGTLTDLDVLRDAAAASDGVLHLGFVHDFDHFAESGRIERAVVQTFADTLTGSDRPFLLASGVAGLAPDRVATEHDHVPEAFTGPDAPRGGSEALALEYADKGVRVVPLRFAPTVHGPGDHGFTARLVEIARERGVAAYIDEGTNRWAAAHRLDVGRMVVLALEKAPTGQPVHGVAEEGIATRDIAAAIGTGLGLPILSVPRDSADEHFGWLGRFFGMNGATSSARTRELLGWAPTHATLLEDIASGSYFG
ncbi:nucleoside-diphosphate-sugar epimerase [Luteimicrobium subarcticum]|uniref:Nucleoside-diphosphate-sugar epimerase n=2 Tax=Luteimicrobium subarcticum TaxID=620910 RepID=A0A2M8WQU6_9MICO|nr:nucleoside-diphosphate-sugar epimerase [Luteimicrobium subarcticum]